MAQDQTRKNLERLLTQSGVDMATVSRAIGKNHAYIQQFLTRGVPRELSFRTAEALARYFSVGIDAFGFGGYTHTQGPAKRGQAETHAIVRLRRLLGLSTTEMAAALGEKPATLTAIERGETPLTERLAYKISRTFDIDPADLGTGSQAAQPALSSRERVWLARIRRLSGTQQALLDAYISQLEATGSTRPSARLKNR